MPDNYEIPNNAKAWDRSAKTFHSNLELQRGLQAHDHQDWKSASKMQLKQYLLLRSYWIECTASEFRLENLVSRDQKKNAEEIIQAEGAFRHYLETLTDRLGAGQKQKEKGKQREEQKQKQKQKRKQEQATGQDGGMFTLVLYQQDEILELPPDSNPESVPKINMTPPPRYETRTFTRRAKQESPTPQAPNAQSAISNVTSTLANLAIGRHSAKTPPGPAEAGNTNHSSTEQSPASEVDSFESTESQLSRFSAFSPSQIKAASDEQIVNMALVSFLQALTIRQASTVRWSVNRSVFRLGVLYEARTDGCLSLERPGKRPLAILETKAHVRKTNPVQIMMQETAQMAAWIKTHPKHGFIRGDSEAASYRRLLISQDNLELYLIIAEYDDTYQDYLVHTCIDSKEGQKPLFSSAKASHQFDASEKGPFLRMRSYGPFDIRRPNHMKSFATAVVALTTLLESSDDNTAEEASWEDSSS